MLGFDFDVPVKEIRLYMVLGKPYIINDQIIKVEEKSSTTFSFSLSPFFFSFLRYIFFSLFVLEISKKGAEYFSLSLYPVFFSFPWEKFSLFSSTLIIMKLNHSQISNLWSGKSGKFLLRWKKTIHRSEVDGAENRIFMISGIIYKLRRARYRNNPFLWNAMYHRFGGAKTYQFGGLI
jgi:hypothetical protein